MDSLAANAAVTITGRCLMAFVAARDVASRIELPPVPFLKMAGSRYDFCLILMVAFPFLLIRSVPEAVLLSI